MTDDQLSRLNNVYNNREKAIAENSQAYDTMANNASQLQQTPNQIAEQYEQTQNQIADTNLAYQTNLINQQKEEAQKAYRKEENKALNSYQAYINPYGTQSETIGDAGLSNSGVSGTMKLGAYGVYQNRVAQANTTLQNALVNYDNQMAEARKDNDVTKAQNALTKLQSQLQNAETYYNNSTSLAQNKLDTINSLNAQYDNQYNTVYNQILNEQEQQEAIRQYNQNFAYQQERDKISDEQWQKQYEESIRQYEKSLAEEQRQYNETMAYNKSKSTSTSTSKTGKTAKVSWNNDNNSKVTPQNTSDYYFKSTTGDDYQPRYLYDNKLENATNIDGSVMKLKNLGITIDGISQNKKVWKGVDANGNTAYYVWDEDGYVPVTQYVK